MVLESLEKALIDSVKNGCGAVALTALFYTVCTINPPSDFNFLDMGGLSLLMGIIACYASLPFYFIHYHTKEKEEKKEEKYKDKF